MSKRLVAFLVALALSSTAVPAEPSMLPAGTYKMDRAHASLTWKVSHLGLSNYTARFTNIDATLDIDPAKPETAKLAVTVDPTSIRTDYPFADKNDFDKELSADDKFFNTSKFSNITFTSTRIERTGATTATVTGDLTFLGVTKPVAIDVTLNGAIEHPMTKQPMLGFSGVATLKRSEFGMTHGIPFVGDDVKLLIEAEFAKS